MTKVVLFNPPQRCNFPLPLPTREVESSSKEEMTLKASKEIMSTTYPTETGKDVLILSREILTGRKSN